MTDDITTSDTHPEADGYYGEGDMGDGEVDLSFLDDNTSEE